MDLGTKNWTLNDSSIMRDFELIYRIQFNFIDRANEVKEAGEKGLCKAEAKKKKKKKRNGVHACMHVDR